MIMSAAPRFVAEITAYDAALGTTRVLRYASGQGFTTKPSETPANTFYDPRIKQPVDISRTMFAGGTTQGRSTYGVGDLILYNDDGLLDDLNDLGFDGQPVTIRRATALNPSYPSDYVTVLVGTMEQAEFTSTEVRIKLRDRMFTVASAPLQTTKYAGSNVLPAGLEGVAADLKGKPKPVCFGVVKNIPMPCVNTSKLIYQANDGAVASVGAVYDRGIPLSVGLTWTVQTSGFGATNINAVCYGNALWVAAGDAGKLFTSPDAVTWTSRTSGFGATAIRGVCYSATLGMYIAVGDSGTLASSPDGTTWTTRTSSFGATNINAVCDGNGLLMAVGDAGKTATSSTGTTWAAATAIGATNLKAVAFGTVLGQSQFVAAGASGVIAYSTAGAAWTTAKAVASGTIMGLAYGRGVWVAVLAVNGAGITSLGSVDGNSWTVRTTVALFEGVSVNGVAYGNGQFMAVAAVGITFTDAQGGYTADGVSWTYLPPGFSTNNANAVAYGAGMFVAVGSAGKLSSTTAAAAAYATLADLQDDTLAPAPGTYKVYLAGGYVRLGSKPTGLVTADVTQGATAANRTAAQLYALVLARAGLSSGDSSAADLAALDVANSAVCGYWTMDEVMCADVCDLIAASVGAWWGVDRTGVFRIKQFTAPSGTAVLALTANDMKAAPERISTNDVGNGIPIYRSTVRWGKYYATLTTDLAGGVDDASRAAFAQDWRDATISDATVQTAHPLSQPLIEESLLTTATDALAEATRRLALRSVKRDRYELVVELNTETEVIDLGDVIEVQHPRFALSVVGSDTGMKFRVLDITPNARTQELRLSVWGRSTGRNRITSTGALRVTSTGAYRVTTQST